MTTTKTKSDSQNGLIISDKNGLIQWSNPTASSITGYTCQDILKANFFTLFPQLTNLPLSENQSFYIATTANPKTGLRTEHLVEVLPIQLLEKQLYIAILYRSHNELQLPLITQQLLAESEERLRRSQAIANIGTWDWNIATGDLAWSDQIYKIFGIKVTHFGASYEAFVENVYEDDREKVNNAVHASVHGKAPYNIEHRIVKRGEVRYVREMGEVFRDENDQPVRMLGTVQDVTDDVYRRMQLQLASTLFNHAYEGMFTTNTRFVILSANPALSEVTGLHQSELIGADLSILIADNQTLFEFRHILKALKRDQHWRGEIDCVGHNTPPFTAILSVTAVRDDSDQLQYYVFTLTDISNIKTKEQQLDYLAHYDQLTKLPNRTHFLKHLEESLKIASRKQQKLAVFYIDLDGFKQINDTQGHNFGDEVLKDIAVILKDHTPANALVARLGGDEFAMVLDDVSIKQAVIQAGKLIKCLAISKRFVDCTIDISASLGITMFPEDGIDLLELLSKSDQAMYQAKEKGKNQYQRFDPASWESLAKRVKLSSDIRSAIRNNEFTVYYQPKVFQDNLDEIKAEALIRWPHPKLGMISPANFIPIAEDTGQILTIGELVFQKVCTFSNRLKQIHDGPIQIAINLSARKLHDQELLRKIKSVLAKNNITAESLEFEVTESVLMKDVESHISILHKLKDMGATIAIDDFGTGYSSLSYLKKTSRGYA